MPYLKLISILFLIVLCNLKSVADKPIALLRYDSVVVETRKPTVEKEKAVFSEVDLDFAKKRQDNDRNFMERFIDWLGNLIFGTSDHNDRRNVFTVFIWVFVIAGLILAVWIFSRSEFSAFLKGNVKNAEFNFEDIGEDLSGIDFSKRIEEAKSAHDFRLAVRWLYLKQLFFLNQKSLISWQPYKTNMDYMNELSTSEFKAVFKEISKVYEYVWYGEYPINQNNFSSLEQQFKKFESLTGV